MCRWEGGGRDPKRGARREGEIPRDLAPGGPDPQGFGPGGGEITGGPDPQGFGPGGARLRGGEIPGTPGMGNFIFLVYYNLMENQVTILTIMIMSRNLKTTIFK